MKFYAAKDVQVSIDGEPFPDLVELEELDLHDYQRQVQREIDRKVLAEVQIHSVVSIDPPQNPAVQRVKDFLKRVHLGPAWPMQKPEFELQDYGTFGRLFLHGYVRERYSGERQGLEFGERIQSWDHTAYRASDEQFEDWFLKAVLRPYLRKFLEHELDEALHLDGKLVNDPHKGEYR